MKILSLFSLFELIVFVYCQFNLTNDSTTIAVLPELTTTISTTLPEATTNFVLTDLFIPTNTTTTTTTTLFNDDTNKTVITTTSKSITPFTSPTTSTPSNGLNLQLKVGLLFANGSKDLRAQFGFGQSAPAITLAMQRAASEQLINNINFKYFQILLYILKLIFFKVLLGLCVIVMKLWLLVIQINYLSTCMLML